MAQLSKDFLAIFLADEELGQSTLLCEFCMAKFDWLLLMIYHTISY